MDMRRDLDRHLSVDYTTPGFEVPTCLHEWLDRPESDSRECLICGEEVFGE